MALIPTAFAATVRGLMRRPGYALTVIATLALGIGAATAVFALVDGVLLSALPFRDADRLLLVRESGPGGNTWNTSVVDYRAIRDLGSSFDSVAAMRSGDALIGVGERAQWLKARWVTAGYFDLLGVAPAAGRAFRADEDREGVAPTVVIGQTLATRTFGAADPVGKQLAVDGKSYTVIGVMPAGAETWPTVRADLWPVLQLAEPTRRGPFFLSTLARMKPGVTLAAATADLDAVSRRIFPLWQKGFQDENARLKPLELRGAVVAGARDFLWIAFAAVGVVLLIALVNNANLMLMRIAQRSQDLGVRAALGASRWRLARLLMGENLLLVALGTAAGIALAAFLLAEYRALGPAVPRIAEVRLGLGAVGFAAGLSALAAMVFALLPLALGAVGRSDGSMTPSRGASAGRDPQRVRDGLVVLEFALALPLLVAAGLLAESLLRLQRVDPGFAPDHVLTASVRISEQTYPDQTAQIAFWDRALAVLRAVPGMQGVALAGALPPSCGCFNNFDIVGRPAAQGSQPASPWVPVDAGFFDALGVRLVDGRVFDSRDTPDAAPVLVVSASWARKYFPGEPAVGKTLYEGGNTERAVTVIGVVDDVRFDGVDQPGETVFAPISQGAGGNSLYVLARGAGDPLAQAEPIRAALQEVDPAIVPAEVAAMPTLLADSIGGQRHWAAVIGGFALAAVLLAAVGVFGVLAYHVANREREIGIRQALGADRRRIVTLVVARGLRCAALGLVLGAVLAAFATRGLEALLFEVGRGDPLAWIAACATLLLVAIAACGLPALRAARIDPQVALRQE